MERVTVKNLQREFSQYRQHLLLISPNTLLQLVMSLMVFFYNFALRNCIQGTY